VEEVMTLLQLQEVAENYIGTESKRGISGGERKRVSIAAEILTNPKILALDEVRLHHPSLF
jgi:ABC-type multidrug transport system ATPase subunit